MATHRRNASGNCSISGCPCRGYKDLQTNDQDYCGCCGAACSYASIEEPWCGPCKVHVGPSSYPPWDRTYYAVNNAPCPFQQEETKLNTNAPPIS